MALVFLDSTKLMHMYIPWYMVDSQIRGSAGPWKQKNI